MKLAIACFLWSFGVFIFSAYKSKGFTQLLKNGDSMFFAGLGSVIFSGALLAAHFRLFGDEEVPFALSYFYLSTVSLSLLLLLSKIWCLEGKGIVINNNYQPKYPVTLTQKSGAIVLDITEAKSGIPFFTREVSLGPKGEKSGDMILFDHPEKFNVGDQVKFRVFSGDAPVIGSYSFWEARSLFSFIKKQDLSSVSAVTLAVVE